MYEKLWTLLPGPPALRVALAVLAAAAVVLLLMTVVFPAVETLLVPGDVAFG
ncbi:hypothetical protein EV188_104327 [Actinomycetospora succinea]|uniref:Uncharacterized protein n=1 Tax=Actinomycetospora succinea TaxID=663603 RepID=A0A4R6VA32_9PSEU|nr:hypothetical protein [Actinomycetospora succinea]TDQ58583.1 hypothetical protein EV188_104327 [Actinomycetospora succinea]